MQPNWRDGLGPSGPSLIHPKFRRFYPVYLGGEPRFRDLVRGSGAGSAIGAAAFGLTKVLGPFVWVIIVPAAAAILLYYLLKRISGSTEGNAPSSGRQIR